jgi:hypothetical protein
MKINDVIVNEYQMGNIGRPGRTTTAGTAGTAGTASQQFPLSPEAQAALSGGAMGGQPPKNQAAQPNKAGSKKAASSGGKVPPQPTLNGKPSTGPKGQAWLKKYGATHNPDGSPKAAATPADPSIDPYDPNKDTNVKMTPQSEIQAAQSDADKKAAISANLPPVAAPAQQGAPNDDIQRLAQLAGSMRQQTTPDSMPTTSAVTPQSIGATNLQGEDPPKTAAPNSGSSYTGDIGTATNDAPAGQAAQPQGNPDYGKMNPQDAAAAYDAQLKAQGKPGLEKGQGVVGTGTGTAMTTGTGSPLQYDHSDAMMAWRQAHPMQSPPDHATAKKWYEKELARKANPQPGFFSNLFGGNKTQDAGPTGNVNNQSSGYTQPQKESSELALIRKLSGLK